MKSKSKCEFSVLTKLIILTLTIIATFVLENVQYMPLLFLGIMCDLIIQRKYQILKRYIPLYLILCIVRWLSYAYNFKIFVFSQFYVFILWWLTPVFMAMHDVMVTSPGVISAFLSKIKAPKAFILGILVTCRFIPTARLAVKGIRESMYNRGLTGIKNLLFHPIKTYEYVLIPMLMMSINTADQLSASAVIRGVQAPCSRGSYYSDNKGIKDFIGLALTIIVIIYTLHKGGVK